MKPPSLPDALARIARILAGESRYAVYQCTSPGDSLFVGLREREDLLVIARELLRGNGNGKVKRKR